jgi:hypothetical protein
MAIREFEYMHGAGNGFFSNSALLAFLPSFYTGNGIQMIYFLSAYQVMVF